MAVYALPQPYEEIEHTADVGVRVRGASAEETLARLVLAFTAIVLGDDETLAPSSKHLLVEVDSGEAASMAIDVLREVLFQFDAHQLLPVRAEVTRFDEAAGAAVDLTMGRFDPDVHLEAVELKAITFHEARFEKEDGEWLAQIIFDI